MEQNTSNLFELHLDQPSTSYLAQVARWGKFLAIVGFIMCALIALGGIFAGTLLASAFGGELGGFSAGAGIGAAIVYILLALLMFFPALYLYRFSVQMQVALRNNDQASLSTSLSNLKSYFKFVGILTIIFLVFYGLIFLFGVLGATMASF